MTALDPTAFEMPAGRRAAIVARVANRVADFLRSWKNRREIYRLGGMTDAELADIGLRRTDLFVAVQTPFGEDPTAQLGLLAQARAIACETAARRVC